MIDSNSLKNTKPIFCDEKKLKSNSLKVYTYLVLLSNLKDNISRDRIFKHKDLNLSRMEKILKMDRRTIQKSMFQLEENNLLLYNVRDNEYLELKTDKERWNYRKHHKDTYYVLHCPERFRRIPQETLKFLAADENISELTYKIYIALTNYQEIAILNKKEKKYFAPQDIRKMLGYEQHIDINKKISRSLKILKAYGLIDYDNCFYNNKYGKRIKAYVLFQANFYVNEVTEDSEVDEKAEIVEDEIIDEIVSGKYN